MNDKLSLLLTIRGSYLSGCVNIKLTLLKGHTKQRDSNPFRRERNKF